MVQISFWFDSKKAHFLPSLPIFENLLKEEKVHLHDAWPESSEEHPPKYFLISPTEVRATVGVPTPGEAAPRFTVECSWEEIGIELGWGLKWW